MDTLTISDFKKYAVIAVQDEKDFDSHLYVDMKKGRKEYLDGKCVESKNHNELLSFLELLWLVKCLMREWLAWS